MAEKIGLGTALQEIAALKEKFELIKKESEDFIRRAKTLSESGIHEAKELMDSAKLNWHSLLTSFGAMGLGSLLVKAKVSQAKTKKLAPNKPKKTTKKASKKTTKKVRGR